MAHRIAEGAGAVRLAAFAAIAFAQATCAQEWPPQVAAPTVNRHAMLFSWGSAWGGPLDAILGGAIRLAPSSTQPKGYVSRLFDGNPGQLDDATASYLIFDGPRADIDVRLPEWRSVDRLDVFTLESANTSRARLVATYRAAAAERALDFKRQVVDQRGSAVRVRYTARAGGAAWRGGGFEIRYDSPDLGSAFVAEVALDGVGQAHDSGEATRPRLLAWQSTGNAHLMLHSVIVAAAATGERERDLVPAWIALPVPTRGRLPLAVLVGAPGEAGAAGELLGFEGRPERAMAETLVRRGMGVLVVDCAWRREPADCAAAIDAVLAEAASGDFARSAPGAIDLQRVGLWAAPRADAVSARVRHPGVVLRTAAGSDSTVRATIEQVAGTLLQLK